MDKLTLIKVGGKIVEEPDTLAVLLQDFASIDGYKVLVHGGGRSATKVASQLGIESRMVNGRRITDADMLRVVTMVYGGLVNKNIVAGLQALGMNALGLTGADMNIMRSDKRPVGQAAGGRGGLWFRGRCEGSPCRRAGYAHPPRNCPCLGSIDAR